MEPRNLAITFSYPKTAPVYARDGYTGADYFLSSERVAISVHFRPVQKSLLQYEHLCDIVVLHSSRIPRKSRKICRRKICEICEMCEVLHCTVSDGRDASDAKYRGHRICVTCVTCDPVVSTESAEILSFSRASRPGQAERVDVHRAFPTVLP